MNFIRVYLLIFLQNTKKYKKLFNNLLIAVIVEALVILAMIIID